MSGRVAALVALMAACAVISCGSEERAPDPPLAFEPATGEFSFRDTAGNLVHYDAAENRLIVEPDVDIEELARAFCEAEAATPDPARFATVGLVLARQVLPFIETVERVCDR